MKRVTGICGIFFKARDPENLKAWYRDRLGIVPDTDRVSRRLPDPACAGGPCPPWR